MSKLEEVLESHGISKLISSDYCLHCQLEELRDSSVITLQEYDIIMTELDHCSEKPKSKLANYLTNLYYSAVSKLPQVPFAIG
ncbi:MAG: hypothetical protein ABIH72_00390 [archaeon]